MIQRWNNMSEDNDGEFVLFTDHCAALAEKKAEIAKLKHELKQNEYKFIRNHNDYYKELCGMREQIHQLQAELDQVMGEAVFFAKASTVCMCQDVPMARTAAHEYLQREEVQSWRARQGAQ